MAATILNANPLTGLEVSAGDTAELKIQLAGADVFSFQSAEVGFSAPTTPMIFYTGGIERLRIDTNGNITSSVSPTQLDNSTKLATTAFVKTAGFQFSGAGSIMASRNLLASDIGNLLINEAAGGTNTFTILSPGAVGARIGDTFSCMTYGTNGLNLAFSGCTYVYGAAGQTAGFSVGTGEWITFVAESSNSWRVVNATAGMKNIESFRSLLATSGYQKLPSGLILQWGRYTAGTIDVAYTVTLPLTYPTANLGVLVTASFAGAVNGMIGANGKVISNSQIQISIDGSNTALTNLPVQWFCFGY